MTSEIIELGSAVFMSTTQSDTSGQYSVAVDHQNPAVIDALLLQRWDRVRVPEVVMVHPILNWMDLCESWVYISARNAMMTF
jgi:hypothetical protein